MDPAVISALSGAPAFLVLAWVLVLMMKDRRSSEEAFLGALSEERRALGDIGRLVRNHSTVLLAAIEIISPERAKHLRDRTSKLFDQGDGGQ